VECTYLAKKSMNENCLDTHYTNEPGVYLVRICFSFLYGDVVSCWKTKCHIS